MTHRITLFSAFSMAALLFTGCVSTSYHPEKDGIGFSEEKKSEQVYSVSLHGDKDTSQQTVENMLLLRMAELTRAEGMDYFTVVLDDTVCATKVETSPTTTCTYEHSTDDRFAYTSLTETLLSDVGLVSKEYEASATFIMGRGTVVSGPADTYVAADVFSEYACLKSPGGCSR